MSAVHEHLYRLDQFSEVDAQTLIPGIVEPLRQGFDHPAEVEYDIDPVVLDRDHATPIALLVNEIVTNSLKHAYPNGKAGKIRVALKRGEGNTIRLRVSDDGQGFDTNVPSQGLGRRLIGAMVMQLNGAWTYSFENGTQFEASIPDAGANASEPKNGMATGPGAAPPH
jgi:two-component sensor histidine kinase